MSMIHCPACGFFHFDSGTGCPHPPPTIEAAPDAVTLSDHNKPFGPFERAMSHRDEDDDLYAFNRAVPGGNAAGFNQTVPPATAVTLSDDELRAIAVESTAWQRRGHVDDSPELNHLRGVGFGYAHGVIAERLRSRARVAELERLGKSLTLAMRDALPAVSWAWTDAQTDPHEQAVERQFAEAHRVCHEAFAEARAAGLLDGEP